MVYCVQNDSNFSINTTATRAALPTYLLVMNSVVFPVELFLGFCAQCVNLWVLHGRKIRSLTYTIYLKALSINYLVAIPLLLPSLLRRLSLVDVRSPLSLAYYAHLEQYLANVFLFSGNLIVAALAAESLRGMLYPFDCLTVTTNRRACVILASAYALTAAVLSPLVFMARVVGPLPAGLYCVTPVHSVWFETARYTLACVFEIMLVLLISGIYTLVFVEYRKIVRRHRRGVQELRQSHSLLSNNRKAIVICLSYITAYLICNAPSAVKESLYLARFFAGRQSALGRFFASPVGGAYKTATNFALLFNFTLTVILQYFASTQYRERVLKMVARGVGCRGAGRRSEAIELRSTTSFRASVYSRAGNCSRANSLR